MNTDITYEQLKPFLTEENLLWTEDDATRNTDGHKGPNQAWKEIFVALKPHCKNSLARIDCGDCGYDIHPEGRVHMWAFDIHQIYQLPEAAMQALGLAAKSAAQELREALGDDVPPPPVHSYAFRKVVSQIDSPALRETCEALLGVREFWDWPASLSHHHAYETGLIQHTLEVASLSGHLATRFPQANKDVLLAAVLWHDLGKVQEYVVAEELKDGQRCLLLTHCDAYTQYWVENPDYRNRIGHINGSAIDFAAMAAQHDVDASTIAAVVHCILAHHGPVKEWGSPVAPQTLEALILHQADLLSAQFGETR